MVFFALKNTFGSEILVPKIPSYNIMDLVKAIGPTCKIKYIGLRPGEKIHEEMISESDSFTTFDLGKYWHLIALNTYEWTKAQKQWLIDDLSSMPREKCILVFTHFII